jgi:amino acid transporter
MEVSIVSSDSSYSCLIFLGLPFARHLSKVEKKRSIPTTSILATTFFLALLGLINIGSTSAFNAILSLATVGLQISYLMPIILLLWRRARSPSTLLYGPFQLGKAGFSINIVAVLYLTFTCIFLLFPPYQPVTPQNMNYASLVLGVVLVFSIFYWIWRGGKRYSGPIIELESFPRLEVLQNGIFMQSETVSSSAKKA